MKRGINGCLFFSIIIWGIGNSYGQENNFYLQLNTGVVFAESYNETEQSTFCNFFGPCFEQSIFRKIKYDTGFAVGGALGYRFSDTFRLELEGLYQNNQVKSLSSGVTTNSVPPGAQTYSNSRSFTASGDRDRSIFLLNAYYDFKNESDFTPFLTAGVGGYYIHASRVLPNTSNISFPGQDIIVSGNNNFDFAWQLGAGVSYKINNILSMDLKYRYLSGSDAQIKSVINSPFIVNNSRNETFSVGDHQIMAGLRIGF